MDKSAPIHHVYPANDATAAWASAQLRQAPSLWEPLCRIALWQEPIGNRPVHSEESALACILNELTQPEAQHLDWVKLLTGRLGTEGILQLLYALGARRLEQEAWAFWHRYAGQDDPHIDRRVFYDKHAAISGAVLKSTTEEDEPDDPTVMPPTYHDENVIWLYSEHWGGVFPVEVG